MDDLAVPQHHRSGAHRARRHPLLSALVVLGSVALASALLLWVLLTFDVLGVGDDLREAGVAGPVASGPAVTPSGEATASVEPSGSASTDPGAAPSAPAEPDVEPSPEPTADRSLPVDVLNSTSTVGLAAGAAEALGDAGWTVGEVGNFEGDETPTVVLYPEESQAVTAQEVASDLGAGEAELSDDVTVLTVVLGSDYTG